MMVVVVTGGGDHDVCNEEGFGEEKRKGGGDGGGEGGGRLILLLVVVVFGASPAHQSWRGKSQFGSAKPGGAGNDKREIQKGVHNLCSRQGTMKVFLGIFFSCTNEVEGLDREQEGHQGF
eukprot:768416-Hanusia_phi.AAC.5